MVTQKDIELLMQSNKELFYKLELLNQDLKVIDTLEGNLISDNISKTIQCKSYRISNN